MSAGNNKRSPERAVGYRSDIPKELAATIDNNIDERIVQRVFKVR